MSIVRPSIIALLAFGQRHLPSAGRALTRDRRQQTTYTLLSTLACSSKPCKALQTWRYNSPLYEQKLKLHSELHHVERQPDMYVTGLPANIGRFNLWTHELCSSWSTRTWNQHHPMQLIDSGS